MMTYVNLLMEYPYSLALLLFYYDIYYLFW